MKGRTYEMVRELSYFLERYSSEEWREFTLLLSDTEFRERLAHLLRSATAYQDPKQRELLLPIQRRSNTAEFLKEPNTEGWKAQFSQLSLSELRDVASRMGIRVAPKDSKTRIISKLARARPSTFKDKRNLLVHSPHTSRDLSRWTEIIMGKKK